MRAPAVWLFAALLFSLVGLWPARAAAYAPPPPDGAVTDTSGKLSADDDTALEAHIAGYRSRTGHELAVLMVGSLGADSVDDVAYAAFNAWGVGKKGADDGVLLVIAPNERKMRIETGKGVGDRLTDLESSHILREKVGPLLKESRFREAILAGLVAIEAALDAGGAAGTAPSHAAPSVKGAKNDPAHSGSLVTLLLPFLVLGFCAFVVIGIVYLIIRAARGPRTSGGSYESSSYSSSTSDWSSGGSSGGSDWSSGSGSSGGGSDFGGGSSGGGGSSDSY